MLQHESLTRAIISAAIDVHRLLGPGLLESTYQRCMYHELRLRKILFEKELAFPVMYKGERIDCGYRLNLIVENTVIVELKAVEKIHPIHEAQLLTYMKLTGMPVGLLINFNVPLLKDGLIRRVL